MTIFEALFGTIEMAAQTLENNFTRQLRREYCWLAPVVGANEIFKTVPYCKNCLYDYHEHSCVLKDITVLEWLNQEVQR